MTAVQHTSGTTRRGTRTVGALLSAVLAVGAVLVSQTVESPDEATAFGNPSIISTFYVPLYENNAYEAFEAINAATNPALSSTTSVTVAVSGTVVYYDHWEDGYEATVDAPSQTTSLVLGDGILSNGDASIYCVPARCAGDIMPSGAVLRLNNSTTVTPGSLTIPRTAASVFFDGRDKISATAGLAVTHATWPTNTDALHAQMAAAFDTSRWGVNFVAPVGVNTPQQGDGFDHFSYTGIEVMARQAGTVVSVDANADGDFLDANDVNGTTIGEGQIVFVNGNVSQGARVTASVPVQAFLMTGRIGSNYADRSFQLFPTEGLVNDYVAPASVASAFDAQASVLYIFNPQNSAITVTVTTAAGSTNYSVPAGQVLNPAPFLDVNQPARITSTATFAALAATGTREGAQGQDFDWGYSLVPARLLSTSINVGWAPGSQNLSAANYDPVWVTATGATTLYVDYDGDPTTGTNLDPNGSRYDTSFAVSGALTLTKVTDPNDNDMTGARIYTTNGATIAAVYGEDPSTAPLGFPGIDLGTALFPVCGALCVQKNVTLADDVDGDGQVDPGDIVEWTVTAANTGYYAITNAILTDTLQAGLTYVNGTTTVGGTPLADDVVPPASTAFPFDESGRNLGTIAVGGTATVRFRTTVDNPYGGPANRIVNRAVVLSDQANGGDTVEVPIDSLRLMKTSNAVEPVTIGDTITYTLTAANAGTSTLAPVTVSDTLPAGLTWVSTSVTRPQDSTTTIADNFDTTDWAGSTGTAAWSQTAWQETNEVTTTPIQNTGQVRNISDLSSRRARFIGAAANQALSRVAGDLTGVERSLGLSFDYRRSGLEADDVVAAQVRSDASAGWTTLASYTNGTDGAYVNATFDISSFRGTATEVRFVVTNNLDDGSDIFYVDNVVLTLVDRVPGTVSGSAPPTVATITELLGGESATITVVTTVTSTPNPELLNIATATSGSFISRARVSDCARCFDFGDAPASYDGANPARARVVATPVTVVSTIADDFQVAANWTGSTGSLAWATSAWTETDGGGLGTTVGRVRKVTDAGDLSLWWNNGSQLNEGVSRLVGDLSTYEGVELSLQKRCNGLEAGDVVTLEVRPDASAAWQVLANYGGCNDAAYVAQSFVLSASQYGTATEVRFRVTNAFGTGTPDQLYIDDVRFDLTDITYPPIGPRLGVELDRELAAASAAPGGAPVGDDLAGTPDDEDGVSVPSMDTDAYTFTFTVTDPTAGPTYVNGWFDWNNDGDFDTAESVFATGTYVSGTGGMVAFGGLAVVPGPGTYSVTIDMPDLSANGSGFALGNSIYSRFRVATSGSEITANKAMGRSSDGEVEDYRTTLNTLPVNLAFVDSTRRGGTLDIDWRTAQEVDNVGFNVYAQNAEGVLRPLNRRLIASSAPTTVEPQEYGVSAKASERTFWIEDVAVDGTKELHGPFTVGEPYGDPTPPEEIDWDPTQDALATYEAARTDEAIAAARRLSQARQTELARTGRVTRTGPLAELRVSESGIQVVTYEDLVAVGVDLSGVPTSTLALTDPQGPVPIDVVGPTTFGAGSSIRFVGEPRDTLYTDENVYRLRIDASMARRIAVDDKAIVGTAVPARAFRTNSINTHVTEAVVERQSQYSVTAPGDDPWYERTMFATRGRTRSASAVIPVSELVGGTDASVSVDVWGITRDAVADEHHVRLAVNGVVVGEERFDDATALTVTGAVPAGVLLAGDNTVTLTLVNDTGVAMSMIAVDRWALTYTSRTAAVDGALDVSVTGRRLDITGMPEGDVVAYRVAGRSSVARVRSERISDIVMVNARSATLRYLVSSTGALHRPTVAAAVAPAELFGGRVDYLIVTHPVLRAGLDDLIAHHRSLGRRVKVVDVNDVYAAYSGGVVDAGAIDTYLAQALPQLGVRWLLVAGADSIDYRDFDGDGSVSLVPSLYGATGFGITYAPMDAAYADVDADGQPDVAMGRFPARTVAELEVQVAKSLAADTEARERNVLLVSDAADGVDYAAINDSLADRFDGWTVRRSDIDRTGLDAARAELLDALGDGTTYTVYLGHSGTHQWTSLGLFDAATAATLPTARPTVVAQFGCWNTYYVSPFADTMGHAFMGDPDGGAAAVLGATTLTSAANDIALAESLTERLAAGSVTIGEALLHAKRDVQRGAGGSTVDVQMGWTLLGDPALSGVPGG